MGPEQAGKRLSADVDRVIGKIEERSELADARAKIARAEKMFGSEFFTQEGMAAVGEVTELAVTLRDHSRAGRETYAPEEMLFAAVDKMEGES